LLLNYILQLEMGKRSRATCDEFSELNVIDRTLQVYQNSVLPSRIKHSKGSGGREGSNLSHRQAGSLSTRSASVRTPTKSEEQAKW
jgi:hypothetical protein